MSQDKVPPLSFCLNEAAIHKELDDIERSVDSIKRTVDQYLANNEPVFEYHRMDLHE